MKNQTEMPTVTIFFCLITRYMKNKWYLTVIQTRVNIIKTY